MAFKNIICLHKHTSKIHTSHCFHKLSVSNFTAILISVFIYSKLYLKMDGLYSNSSATNLVPFTKNAFIHFAIYLHI